MNSISYTLSLWQHFQRLLRSWQIGKDSGSKLAEQSNPSSNTSLLCLPDDILLLILDQLAHNECPEPRMKFYDNSQHLNASDYLNLTFCNHRLRNLAAPHIFRRIHLGRSWSVKHTIESLSTLQQCKAALHYGRELKVDLWVDVHEHRKTGLTAQLPRLGHLLATTMSRLEGLENLSLSTTIGCAESLYPAFLESGLTFSQVRELKLGYNLSWIIPLCPNVHTISSDDWLCDPRNDNRGLMFIQAAGKAPRLRHFAFHARWNVKLLRVVWEAMPQLQSLGLDGGKYLDGLESLLVPLKSFKGLKRLRVTEHEWFVVAVQEVVESGTKGAEPTMSPYQEAVVKLVFRSLAGLVELSIGKDFRAWVVHRRSNNVLDLKWEADVSAAAEQRTPDEWLDMENICTLGVAASDELEAMLTDMEDDTRSTFSRADTLAF